MDALIAQLDRVSDYGSEGYGFDSYWARQDPWNIIPRVFPIALLNEEAIEKGSLGCGICYDNFGWSCLKKDEIPQLASSENRQIAGK